MGFAETYFFKSPDFRTFSYVRRTSGTYLWSTHSSLISIKEKTTPLMSLFIFSLLCTCYTQPSLKSLLHHAPQRRDNNRKRRLQKVESVKTLVSYCFLKKHNRKSSNPYLGCYLCVLMSSSYPRPRCLADPKSIAKCLQPPPPCSNLGTHHDTWHRTRPLR